MSLEHPFYLDRLASGKKLNDKLDADQTSKIYVRFGLKARDSFISANQVFVRFADQLTNNEIVFVAEQNADSKTYSCDVDLASHSKSFNHKNGVYSVQLLLSDPLVSNSKVIDLADINMKFGEQQQSKTPSKAQLYAPKPEIKHLFRVAEPTPSKLVSTVFTILCSLPSAVLVLIVSRQRFSCVFPFDSIPQMIFLSFQVVQFGL
jgi:oligosaccharyltransferase complex subunit delta (ribophorin II)